MIASTLKSQRGKAGGGIGPEETLVAETLREHPRPGSNSNGQIVVAAPLTKGSATGEGVNPPGRRQEDDVNLVAFHPTGGGAKGLSPTEDGTTPGIGTGAGGTVAVAVSENQRGELLETDIAHQLTGGGGKPGQGYSAVREGASVRRLLPVECERLQGLPDGWTQLGETPDSRRYAALGDAVTATVGEWIGRRLASA